MAGASNHRWITVEETEWLQTMDEDGDIYNKSSYNC